MISDETTLKPGNVAFLVITYLVVFTWGALVGTKLTEFAQLSVVASLAESCVDARRNAARGPMECTSASRAPLKSEVLK